MNEIDIKLENCYGIRGLEHKFSFGQCGHVAIYASNGTMKSSLARTLRDQRQDKLSRDRIFTDRKAVRSIRDERGRELSGDAILVISPYDDSDVPKMEDTSSLILASEEELRREYSALMSELNRRRQMLIKALSSKSGTKRAETEGKLLDDLAGARGSVDKIFAVLESYNGNYPDGDERLAGIKYEAIFSSRGQKLLENPVFKKSLGAYVQKYRLLLDQSPYFAPAFDHSGAAAVGTKLENSGFFKADHSVNLNSQYGGPPAEAKNKQAFDKIVEEEMITINAKMDAEWQDIDKLLSPHEDTKEFRRCVAEHKHILQELDDPASLRRKFWMSYLAEASDLVDGLVDYYKSQKARLQEMVDRAQKESAAWDEVVRNFKRRFSVPFTISVTNRSHAVLDGSIPALQFEFAESGRTETVERDLLHGSLSTGELKAFYLLTVLFEIEKRRRDRQETVIVVDDVADSFDYKHKHAIIQYLHEISEEKFFHLVILTHNFDFFRTVLLRRIVRDKNCYFASKRDKMVEFTPASNIRNPLGRIVSGLNDPKNLIAAVPFARNIVEYTKSDKDHYKKLTSLLHWRGDTIGITVGDLLGIICATFPKSDCSQVLKECRERRMLDIMCDEADGCLEADVCLEPDGGNDLSDKIVLSVGIRIRAERFMARELFGDSLPPAHNPRTYELIKEFKRKFPDLAAREADGAGSPTVADTLDEVNLTVHEAIHLNSFMYEPIIDMDSAHLKDLYRRIRRLDSPREAP